MVYVKLIDSDGFVFVATLNAETGGNSNKAEHDAVAEMYRNAGAGYGVVETEDGFAYALRPATPAPDDEEISDSEAVEILMEGESG